MARTKQTRRIPRPKPPPPPPKPKIAKKPKVSKKMQECAAKVWEEERPILERTVHQKGYKRDPYPKGAPPPEEDVKGLLKTMQKVDFKKAEKGHVRRWRKKYEHTDNFPMANPHDKVVFFGNPKSKN